jgi:hypothetical protein
LTPQQFISVIAPAAVAFMRSHRISAALIIVQGALESGWGKTAATMGNNIFGIKADASWHGPTTTQQTKEFVNGQWETVTAKFRAYPSIQACIEDHDGFLLQSRYANLVGADYKTACHLIAAVDHYATDPTYATQLLEIIQQYELFKYDEEATKMTYQSAIAQLNGKPYAAVAINDETYPIWTLAREAGANLTKVAYGDVEIGGTKPRQVTDGQNTYIHYADIVPKLTPHALPGGGFNFTVDSVSHDYQLTVDEEDTEIAGRWAPITITTLDGDKPLGHQTISISENGVLVCTDYTDATSGQYGYAVTETTDKTDSISVSWTDPNGKTHTVVKTTKFSVPKVTSTPLPTDDSIVVQFPLLPASDVSNAILFSPQTTTGQALTMQLDTGAFELMLTAVDAKALNAPNLGSTAVQGVGGQSQGYYSQVTLVINGVTFKDIPCVVDPDFQGNSLFGYRFFIDNAYELLISQKHNTVTFCK